MTIVLALLLAATPSEWLGKREMLTREAERLEAAYKEHAGATEEPAENVVLPLDTHPDGSICISVEAKRALLFPKEDFILAWDVKIQKFDEHGEMLSKIVAKTCLVDRTTKSGWAEGPVEISNAKTAFHGENVYFSSIEGYVMSRRKSKLQSTDLKLGGVL